MSYRDRLASGEWVDLRPKPAVRVNAKYGKLWRSSRTVEAPLLSELLTTNTGASGWTHRRYGFQAHVLQVPWIWNPLPSPDLSILKIASWKTRLR